jgi:transposase-like protein
LREVFPTAREQRCWFHKIGNVFSALSKSAHPGAKRALAEIWNADDREHARRAVAAFTLAYGAKFGKAVAKITDDLDELLAFYDYPAEHWVHLRGSKAASLAMAFKLMEAAQARWRAVNTPPRRPRPAPALANAAGWSSGPRRQRHDAAEGLDARQSPFATASTRGSSGRDDSC